MSTKHHTLTLEQIPSFAQALAKKLRGGEVLALIGPLGAGKTTFTQALGRTLGIKSRITSPTFVVMRKHQGKKLILYHLDLYRTRGLAEVRNLGLEEFMGNKGTVTVIEWADKVRRYLPLNTIYINFK